MTIYKLWINIDQLKRILADLEHMNKFSAELEMQLIGQKLDGTELQLEYIKHRVK